MDKNVQGLGLTIQQKSDNDPKPPKTIQKNNKLHCAEKEATKGMVIACVLHINRITAVPLPFDSIHRIPSNSHSHSGCH